MRADDVIKIIRRALLPIKRKVMLTIGRGVLMAVQDGKDLQQMQITLLADEVKGQVEHMGHFGFASRCPKGGDLVMVSVGGSRDHGIVIATEHREFRFKNLGDGESALYSKDGDYIHLKNGNVIDIKTKTLNIEAETSVNITTPIVNISKDVAVGGNMDITGDESVGGNETVGGNSEVTGNVTAVGNVQGAVLTATTSMGAPAIAAQTSMVVAGQELSGYKTHSHTYEDDNGSGTTTKSTSGVS